MKIFFGATLAFIGIITLILGLTKIYSRDSSGAIATEAIVGGILVLGGMVAHVTGANIAKGETFGKLGNVAKSLHVVSFITSIAIIIIGLFNVFAPQNTLMSVALLFVGFVAAISSASNAIAEDREKRE